MRTKSFLLFWNALVLVAILFVFKMYQVYCKKFSWFESRIDRLNWQDGSNENNIRILYNIETSKEDQSLEIPNSFRQQEQTLRDLFRIIKRQAASLKNKETALDLRTRDYSEKVENQVHCQ